MKRHHIIVTTLLLSSLPQQKSVPHHLPLAASNTFTMASFQIAGNSNQHPSPSMWVKQPTVLSKQFVFIFSIFKSQTENGETNSYSNPLLELKSELFFSGFSFTFYLSSIGPFTPNIIFVTCFPQETSSKSLFI